MQRLAGLSISDPAHLDLFIRDHGDLVDVAAGYSGGGWGLGLWRAGEMLTRKTPIGPGFDGLPVLRGTRSRQLILVADASAALRSSRSTMQPLRFRNWVFAVTGTVSDAEGFTSRAKEELSGFGKSGLTIDELAMTTLMHALHRANVLDRRPLSTSAYHQAIAHGVERLTTFAGGRDALRLAFTLHLEGYLMSVAAGRSLRLHQRSSAASHWAQGPRWWATVVTDYAAGDAVEGGTFDWSGLEVDSHGAMKRFALS